MNAGQRQAGFTLIFVIVVTAVIAAANNRNESLTVKISGVIVEQAAMLDNLVDGADGSAAGRIHWNAGVNDTTTLFYYIPVNKGC